MNRNHSQAQRNDNGSSTKDEYFDLHTRGCGYLNRIREVPAGRNGSDSFLACSISALRGLCNDPSYTYFDLRCSGEEAEQLVRSVWDDVDNHAKVFVAFQIGDIYVDPYMGDEKDARTGRPTGRKIPKASIKGRLLLITHLKVNDETVYQAPARDELSAQNQDAGGGNESVDEAGGDTELHDDANTQRSEEAASTSEPRVQHRGFAPRGRQSAPAQRNASGNRPAPRDRTALRMYRPGPESA